MKRTGLRPPLIARYVGQILRMQHSSSCSVLGSAVFFGVVAGLVAMFVHAFWGLDFDKGSGHDPADSVVLAFVVGPVVGLAVVASSQLSRRFGRSGSSR